MLLAPGSAPFHAAAAEKMDPKDLAIIMPELHWALAVAVAVADRVAG